MRIVFSTALDAGAWPGPLNSERAAALGEAWVGPRGLTKLLETWTGQGGVETSAQERSALLAARLTDVPGFWSRSAEVDAFGAAQRVLRMRDELLLSGLSSAQAEQPPAELPARVRAVLEVTRGLPLSSVARLVRALDAAPDLQIDDILELAVDARERALLPALHQRALTVLESRAARVVAVAAPAAADERASDLRRAASAAFAPVGDGSLWLLRADCPEEAAAEVGQVLRARGRSDDVVIIGADPILDAGLVRAGLPVTGARGGTLDDALLQVLPLVVSLGVVRDPDRAAELLSLPLSPLPRFVARPALRALGDMPSLDSPAWSAALTEALARVEDPARRTTLSARLAMLFGPPSLVLDDIQARAAAVHQWLRGRADGDERSQYGAALVQSAVFLQMLRAQQGRALSVHTLTRMLDDATRAAPVRAARAAEAGCASVREPGAVLGPANVVVWWRFVRDAEPVPRSALAPSAEERAALLACGVDLPPPSRRARLQAQLAERPLAAAQHALWLNAPLRDAAGQDAHPHPFWDEVVGRAGGDPARVRTIVGKRIALQPTPPQVRMPPVALPQPVEVWPVPAVVDRAMESASSFETLLGCSFRYLLDTLHVRHPARLTQKTGAQLFGLLAHDVLERLVKEGVRTDEEEVAARARALFEERAPLLAGAYQLPGEAFVKKSAQERIVSAATALMRQLAAAHTTIAAVEEELVLARDGRSMKGRPDLIVGPPYVVIDYKTGGDIQRAAQLRRGAAVQLTYYAFLWREHMQQQQPAGSAAAPWPAIAFFQLRSGRMLTSDSTALPKATLIAGDKPQQIHRAMSQEGQRVLKELRDAHTARAPGAVRDPAVDDTARVPPPCATCDRAVVCGRMFRAERGGRP